MEKYDSTVDIRYSNVVSRHAAGSIPRQALTVTEGMA